MIRFGKTSQVEVGPDAGAVTIANESAQVCGVIGCTQSKQLLRVKTNRGVRILCPQHVGRWID